jgi:hypothetical protein
VASALWAKFDNRRRKSEQHPDGICLRPAKLCLFFRFGQLRKLMRLRRLRQPTMDNLIGAAELAQRLRYLSVDKGR